MKYFFLIYALLTKEFFIFKQIVVQATLERYSMNSKWIFKRIAKFPPKEALPASLAQSCTCPSNRVLLKGASAFPLGGFAGLGTAGPSFFAQLLFSNSMAESASFKFSESWNQSIYPGDTHCCSLFTHPDCFPQGAHTTYRVTCSLSLFVLSFHQDKGNSVSFLASVTPGTCVRNALYIFVFKN